MRNGVIIADGAPAEVITSERLTPLHEVPIYVAAAVVPSEMNGELRTCIPLPLRQAPSEWRPVSG